MRILAVDDNPVDLGVYERVVGQLDGCEVVPFTSSAEALGWCEDGDVDLAIVDYQMPAPDGLEFLRRFRRIGRMENVPLFLVTVARELDVRYKALELGANDFLNKPVDPVELQSRLKNMLALRAAQRRLSDRAAWLANEVATASADIVARERETVLRLAAAAEHRDPETALHIVRMGHYCRIIGKAAGLSEELQELLLSAAPMHDLGKIATPDRILLKPGKLTSPEFEVMKQHTIIGYQILTDRNNALFQTAAEIALSHHENFDGSGYPHGLAGEDIPLMGRICRLADVFDALTSERPYKKAWPIDEALAEIQRAGGRDFDPRLADAFMKVLPEILRARAQFSDESSGQLQREQEAVSDGRAQRGHAKPELFAQLLQIEQLTDDSA